MTKFQTKIIMSELTRTQVMIVDDRASVRKGLTTFLGSLDDVEVVAEASSGLEAVQVCSEIQPDVVLMDLEMPGMDGIAATKIIHHKFPDIQIIVLTTFIDEKQAQSALQAGAVGCLLKDVSAHELASAIRSANVISS